MPKTYDQFCPIARGLDLLGERWTLLILRELSLGDQRFTDLRRALVGIAPNLLSDRLRRLQEDGLVEQVELAPPADRTVYRLTDEGARAVPVLRALARFGGRHLPEAPPSDAPAKRTVVGLLAPWVTRDAMATGLDVVVEVDGDRHRLVVDARGLHVLPVEQDDASAPALHLTSAALAAARRDGVPVHSGQNDEAAAGAFAAAFELSLA